MYRIREQYGKFFVEKRVEEKTLLTKGINKILFDFFGIGKLEYETKIEWLTENDWSKGIIALPFTFNNKSSAEKYIEQLKPIYHEYDPKEVHRYGGITITTRKKQTDDLNSI